LNLHAIPLFRFRGIPVQIHWSWFLVGALEVMWRSDMHTHWIWGAVEFVMLFALVLLHEFGHAFACRQVGGSVDRILLWPLGGLAQVRPPQRPGPQLWALIAGPLVNLALAVPALLAWLVLGDLLPGEGAQNALVTFAVLNLALFFFNMLPIYPLDGGQVLRSVLWFFIGRERSLLVAGVLGLVASVIGALASALILHEFMLVAIAVFAAWRSWVAIRVARARLVIVSMPKHPTARCPSCHKAPPAGPILRCANGHLMAPYDGIPAGKCPSCEARIELVACVHCDELHAPAAALGSPDRVVQVR
jgi:Zn-dependent protease